MRMTLGSSPGPVLLRSTWPCLVRMETQPVFEPRLNLTRLYGCPDHDLLMGERQRYT